MRKFLFLPVSILAGVLGGILARKSFDRVWEVIDAEDPPDPRDRNASWGKLILALALEGAIMRAVRGTIDHGARAGYLRYAGEWPGEADKDQ